MTNTTSRLLDASNQALSSFQQNLTTLALTTLSQTEQLLTLLQQQSITNVTNGVAGIADGVLANVTALLAAAQVTIAAPHDLGIVANMACQYVAIIKDYYNIIITMGMCCCCMELHLNSIRKSSSWVHAVILAMAILSESPEALSYPK